MYKKYFSEDIQMQSKMAAIDITGYNTYEIHWFWA